MADTLTPAQRNALLPMWALYVVESHSPRTGPHGETCDEMGCGICNAGDEWIETLVLACTEGVDYDPEEPPWRHDFPDDAELIEALGELAAMWCD